MSRRGEAVYEERDYYSRDGPAVRVREREDDTRSRRSGGSERGGSRPDFLRDDYGHGRPEMGQMVLRERDTEVFSRPLERRPRSPSPVRVVRETRERIIERSPSPPPQLERIRTRVVERREPSSPPPPPAERVRTTTRVVERQRSPSPPPPERLRARVIETRERYRERSPSPVRMRERIVEREREFRERSPSPVVDRVRIRNVEQVRPPSPEPSPSPSPPPPPQPPQAIHAPPIHQEIITHHRHIDHGMPLEYYADTLLTIHRLRNRSSPLSPSTTTTAATTTPYRATHQRDRHRHLDSRKLYRRRHPQEDGQYPRTSPSSSIPTFEPPRLLP